MSPQEFDKRRWGLFVRQEERRVANMAYPFGGTLSLRDKEILHWQYVDLQIAHAKRIKRQKLRLKKIPVTF